MRREVSIVIDFRGERKGSIREKKSISEWREEMGDSCREKKKNRREKILFASVYKANFGDLNSSWLDCSDSNFLSVLNPLDIRYLLSVKL